MPGALMSDTSSLNGAGLLAQQIDQPDQERYQQLERERQDSFRNMQDQIANGRRLTRSERRRMEASTPAVGPATTIPVSDEDRSFYNIMRESINNGSNFIQEGALLTFDPGLPNEENVTVRSVASDGTIRVSRGA